ncbi:hypothetical protein [Enterovirga aerilata]|uniref:Uncharacterized protein n=1 Tax=Enterovirga aerilata TaxID=2730920 RepID=A0A849IB01_9HYPH|nr:hypothetical protein [Enterovirga sp. DB1703]NNM75084.1 hypothetical protein [Enterovirga sp. DB1703]
MPGGRPRKYPPELGSAAAQQARRRRLAAEGYATVRLDIPPDLAAALDAARKDGESRVALILRSIEKEVARRKAGP